MSAPNPYFQIGLDVRGQSCLIIGGGGEAEDKAARLLVAGAEIALVSPSLTPHLQEWVAQGCLDWQRRLFEPADVTGRFLTLNTVRGDHDLSRQVYELALAERSLVNCFDSPRWSNFGMVALVSAGHLRLGISTSNTSPSLAGRLRQDLELLFDEVFVEYIEQLGRVRNHLKDTVADSGARREVLRSLVGDFHLTGTLTYPADWRQRVAELLGSR